MLDHNPQGCIVPPCSTAPHGCPAWCLVVPEEGSPGAAASLLRRRTYDEGEVRWKQQAP
jgi:hypothetical protein